MGRQTIKYLQIEEDIIEAIKEGKLLPGDKVDSESVLKKRYGVSAITVRKAFSDLIHLGYLNGVQGLGTFVAKRQMIRGLTSLSFSEELLQQKFTIDLTIDGIEEIIDGEIAKILDIPIMQSIVCVKRARLANGSPVAYHTSYVDSRRLSLLEAQKIRENKSFYETLQSVEQKPAWASENYSIRDIEDVHISELMKIPCGTAAFFCKRTAYDREDKIVEYAETYFNRDWYSVSVTIKG